MLYNIAGALSGPPWFWLSESTVANLVQDFISMEYAAEQPEGLEQGGAATRESRADVLLDPAADIQATHAHT